MRAVLREDVVVVSAVVSMHAELVVVLVFAMSECCQGQYSGVQLISSWLLPLGLYLVQVRPLQLD